VDTDLVLHVVDASADHPEHQISAVRETLQSIEAHEVPEILVLNKSDAVTPEAIQRLRNMHPDAVVVSAHTKEGLDALMERIEDAVTPEAKTIEVLIPFDRGDVVALVHEVGDITSETHEADGTRIAASVPVRHLAAVEKWVV
jgi:GTP-binding protein HflX